jgi:hypothetical protein
MNIYLLNFISPDEYEIIAVVVAETGEQARQYFIDSFPNGNSFLSRLKVSVKIIGAANSGQPSGVVCYDSSDLY